MMIGEIDRNNDGTWDVFTPDGNYIYRGKDASVIPGDALAHVHMLDAVNDGAVRTTLSDVGQRIAHHSFIRYRLHREY